MAECDQTLPRATQRSCNLVRFGRHLPEETLDASFAADFSFRDCGSRFSILKSVKIAPLETLECRFAFRFQFNDEPVPAWPADIWHDASLEQAIADTERAYDALPEPPARFACQTDLASFIPVYAGIAPREVADAACRDYLLSPAHFLTAMPFPVIDRAHPTFRRGGWLHEPPSRPGALVQQAYWRRRTWIHGDCWLLGALRQSGFQEEADTIAERILAAVGKNEAIHECYDSLTGYGNGHPEFLWSSAAVLMLIHRFYTRPPVATLAPGAAPAESLPPDPLPPTPKKGV